MGMVTTSPLPNLSHQLFCARSILDVQYYPLLSMSQDRSLQTGCQHPAHSYVPVGSVDVVGGVMSQDVPGLTNFEVAAPTAAEAAVGDLTE